MSKTFHEAMAGLTDGSIDPKMSARNFELTKLLEKDPKMKGYMQHVLECIQKEYLKNPRDRTDPDRSARIVLAGLFTVFIVGMNVGMEMSAAEPSVEPPR